MVRVVAGVLRNDERDYFLARRSGINYRGCWETPGGKVDPGETDQQALIREWAEEFGIDITGRVGSKVFETELSTADLVQFSIAAYEVSGVPLPSPGTSHDLTIWATPGDVFQLPERERVPSLRLIVDAFETWDRRCRAHRCQPAEVPVVWVTWDGTLHWDCPFCVDDCDVEIQGESRRVTCPKCGSSWVKTGRHHPSPPSALDQPEGVPWVRTSSNRPPSA